MGLLMGFVGPRAAGRALPVWEARSALTPRGAAVLVVASLAWACGSLYSKHGGMPSSPMLGVAMQSFAGGAILLVAGLFVGRIPRSTSWRDFRCDPG